MMNRFLLLLALLPAAPGADAVIAAKTPPSTIYASAAAVVTGKVTRISPETGTVEAAATTLTGQPVGDTVKLKIADLPNVLSNLKPDAPLVLFVGKRAGSSALHLADTWLFPEPVPGSKGNFVVKKDLESNLRQSYPGTTAALVKVVEELKANNGKYSMLNEVSPKTFHGGLKDMGAVHPLPAGSALFATSLAGDKRQTLLLADKGSLTALKVTPHGISTAVNATNLPAIPTDGLIALAVVDATGGNKPAVLALKATGELLLAQPGNAAPVTKKLWDDSNPATAAALGNFGEDPDRIYALVVKADDVHRYALDGSSPPADFARLTGEKVATYHKENPKWLAGATAAPLDANGDGKTDVLINTPSGPMLLINRGFGTFFINADLQKTLVDAAGKPVIAAEARWTCADVDADGNDDLLVISEVGKVTAVLNPRTDEKR